MENSMVEQDEFKKIYKGRKENGRCIVTVDDESRAKILEPLVRSEYKPGFEFRCGANGYMCFGMVRLAEAVLADFFELDRKAFVKDHRKVDLAYYLAKYFFGRLENTNAWSLTSENIEEKLFDIEQKLM
jgi:hypothetical protein